MRARSFAVAVVSAIVLLSLPGVAGASHVSCGQVLTTDTVLDSDLVCTTQSALIVGADDVIVDLNGHEIRAGAGYPTVVWGVRSNGRDRVTVKDGIVRGFELAGVQIVGEDAVVKGVTFAGNNFGLDLIEAERARVEDNRFDENRTSVGIDNSENPSEGQNAVRRNVFTDTGGDGLGVTLGLTTGNRIEDNDMATLVHGVSVSDQTTGNLVSGNRITVSHTGISLFGDGSRNEIVGNSIKGGSVGIGIDHIMTGGEFRIADNSIEGFAVGILSEVSVTDMRIEDNVVEGGTHGGILVDWQEGPLPAHRATIAGNRVAGGGADGVFVSVGPAQAVLEANLVSGSGDDGIDVASENSVIAENSAWENGDWGIVAVRAVTDGGGNRAWSNGQAAQCLNVACGPGPPSSIELSPQDATNVVGDRHCVAATVRDPDGRPTQGVVVRFSVGAQSGAATSDSRGEAQFCYDGPLAPGTDEIRAFADTNSDGSRDADEPEATATKTWVVPGSSRCRVQGRGTITASNGDNARLELIVYAPPTGAVRGRHFYRDLGPAEPLMVRSRRIEAVTCAAGRASVFGTATSGSMLLRFRVDVMDQSRHGEEDTYRIRTSGGYDSGEAPLTSGEIRVR